MKSVFATTGTVFFQFQLVRSVGFVSLREVVEVATLGTLEAN